MSADELDAVAVGDVVQVTAAGSRRTHVGTVVKIGRTLVHIDEGYGRIGLYYRAGGRRRDGYSGGFRTVARVADDELSAATVKRLRERGIELRLGYSSDWTTARLVELAEAVERIKGATA